MNVDFLKEQYILNDQIFNMLLLELYEFEIDCTKIIIRFSHEKLEKIIEKFWAKMDENFTKNNYQYIGKELEQIINMILDMIVYRILDIENFKLLSQNYHEKNIFKLNAITLN